MKVDFQPAISTQKTTIKSKGKKLLKDFVERLRVLSKDVFEKETKANVTKKNIVVARENPNWCDSIEDSYRNNTVAYRIKYYAKDLDLMKTMSEHQAEQYRIKLEKEGRFIKDYNSIEEEKARSVLNTLGLDLDNFIEKATV